MKCIQTCKKKPLLIGKRYFFLNFFHLASVWTVCITKSLSMRLVLKSYHSIFILYLFTRIFHFPLSFPGLAFSSQICDDLPVTERDMPLDHVITSEPD